MVKTKKNATNKKIIISAVCALAINLSASDLGTIQVESSTIDDKFNSKKSEVSSTSTISGKTVDNAHIENAQQVLQSIPGITTEVKSGDSIKIHIRGLENQMYMGEKPGVAVVIDGVPVFERTGSVNIDLDNIESIRVVKGGASYLFGDDALAGAVIITTKKGAQYNHNFAAVEVGSFGYRKYLARTGYSNEDLNFHIQASQRKSDGYHDKSDYDTKYVNGKFQYYIDNSSDVNFGVEYAKRKKDSHGTVGGETEAENNPESNYYGDQDSRDYARKFDVELLKAFLTYSKDFEAGGNILLNSYVYTDTTDFVSKPQTVDGSGSSYGGDDDYVYGNHYEQIQKGIKSEYRDSFFNSFATLLGADLRANEYKNRVTYLVNQPRITYGPYTVTPNVYTAGDFKSDDKTYEDVYAFYGEYKQSITKDLSATANFRYDSINLDYSDSSNNKYKKSFNVYSYRLGTDYQLDSDSTLYANFSTGFRAPTVSQLYAGDVSTYGDTQNNPDLKPEQSQNYEIGVRTTKHKINLELSIFQLDRNDFIMKTSGNYGASSSTYTDMWDNIGGARHRGVELSTKGPLSERLSFNLAYTYLDAVYTDYHNFGIDLDGNSHTTNLTFFDVTGNRIPRTSKHQINLITDYQSTKNLTFTAEGNYKSSYYADDLNRLKIKAQTVVNLGVNYKTKISMFDMSVFARIDNLLDNQYYNTARSSSDRNDDGVFDYEDLSITVNPGRVITAGLSLKF